MAKYDIDDQVKEIIIKLCDLGLRNGGLANKPNIDIVLNALSNPIKEDIKK